MMTKKNGVSVNASPFNTIKYELALIMVGAFSFWLLFATILPIHDWELIFFMLYSVCGALWIVFRARMVLQQQVARGKKSSS